MAEATIRSAMNQVTTEKELDASSRRASAYWALHRSLFLDDPEPILIVGVGAGEWANPAALRTLHIPPDHDLDWQSIEYRVFTETGKPVNPTDWPLARAMRGEKVDGVTLHVEHRHRPRRHRIHIAHCWPVKVSGQVVGAVCRYKEGGDVIQRSVS